jgi:endonuclease III
MTTCFLPSKAETLKYKPSHENLNSTAYENGIGTIVAVLLSSTSTQDAFSMLWSTLFDKQTTFCDVTTRYIEISYHIEKRRAVQ